MGIEFKVTVHKAEGLLNAESGGLLKKKDRKSDPFAQIIFKEFKGKTKTIDNTLDPEWNEDFNIPMDKSLDSGSELTVEIYDYEKVGGSRPLGMAVIRLAPLLKKGSISQEWYRLQPKKSEAATGRVQLSMTYNDPDNPPEKEVATASDAAAAATELDGGGGGVEGDGEGGGAVAGTPRVRLANRKATKNSTPRTTKVVDWQVRIHVIEGRNLIGSTVDPVAKIVIGTQRKQSRVHKTNANPRFDEYFVFNFQESSQKLFDQVVELKVFNAKRIFKDALIGSFSIDIGTIYDEDNHQFPNTWIMLTDIDSGDSSVRGYLKVTMTVLGPGDEAVIPEDTEDDADFETKVLRPFGAELETIDICFKMYSAEDVPQKDVALQTGVKAIDKFTGQADKMYCDPYAKVIFAGKFNTTKVIDDTYFPEWNEEIHLMAQIPSMLNKIKLQLWDSDTPSALVGMKIEAFRSGDDIIATHHLVLNEISSIDADFGFLPTFGPVYVPLYGGPRKFQTVYDDHYKRIDEGVGEGMAYRGRVLCEVSAKPLGEDKLGENAALMPSDIDRAKAFLRRIEYHLKVVIGEVNFLDPDQFSKGDLTFEVSIGMVGNIDALPDDTPNPVNSLTFPAPGISDGAHYRTIAFDNKKPCIELRSEWEDVLFRIFALNQYRLISLNLKEGVDFAAALVVPTPSGEVDERKVDQAREHLREVINKLIADSERPLPELPESLCTPLDRRILEKRQREMATTAFECRELLENLMNRQISVQDCIGSLKATEKHMAADAFESQISIPDIIVWLFHKNERVAYHRFPVADFCFSKNGAQRGAKYGKPQTVFLKSVKPRPKKAVRDRIPGQIQLRIFFGSTDSLPDWPRLNGQGVILAESYENQRYFPIKGWGDMLLPTDPPKFSDKRGKEKKPKDTFKEPEGWTWNGDWYVDPDIPDVDIYGDQDLVVIEVFENERKQPIAGYCKTLLPTDPPTWSDRAGTEKRVKDEVELPKGWTWRTSWQIDMTRAVDKDGWEYGSSFKSDFHASAKRFDLVRRRRWYIERIKDPEYKGEDEGGLDHGDGWLYALDFGNRFRPTHSTLDAVRRRRWHRELISGKEYQKTLADLPTDFPAAGTFFAYKGKATYQFRGHMYQGRDLPAEDSNAFSDAFARVVFVGGSSRTIVVEKSLTPMWDQTVVFEVTLYGNSDDPKTLFDEISPRVVVELYDKDAIGDDDLLGRFTAYPVFRSATNPLPAVLAWYSSKRIDEECGEVLAAFEVIPVKDAPKFPLPKPVKIKEPITRTKMDVIRIPEDIRPELEPCEIEVLTWGLRNLKRVYLLTVNKPSVTVECGGIKRETDPIKSMKKFPNFETNVLSFQVDLPVKEIYAPPLNILVYDNRKFGAKPLVGSVSLKSVKNFRAKPGDIYGEIDLMRKDQRGASIIAASAEETVPVQDEEAALVPPDDARSSKRRFGMGMFTNTAKMLMNAVTSNNEPTLEPDDTIDWWNKFFASVGEEQTGAPYEGDLVEIYSQSLEQRFDLEQIIKTFTLLKGKSGDQEEKGQFKGNFRIFSLNQQPAPMNLSTALTKKDESGRVPHPWGHLPDKTPVEVFVRLYLVRGIELQPRDSNGKSDPFAVVTFGKNKPVNDKKNYIARNLNPIFGRVFEMPCVLPRDGELLVQIFDYDMIGSNDLIGETKIDLETRFLTRKRATAGLSKHYRTEGLSAWRDALKPSQILEKFCEDQLISQPVYSEYVEGQAVTCTVPEINGGALFAPTEPDLYETSELAKENAALMVLHFVGLVREHIETRTLYDPMQPDMDQGKIQMWVDIFPKADGPAPEPVNITPRKPKKYELRVVVYNTVEVDFADVSITGEEMSDIYIKSLIRGMEDKRQKTDVHYRSLNGEGNFNWRQVFPFEYIPAEERVHIEKRAHIFSSEFEVFKVPPTLSLQIWDADIFGPDEFIGSIDIDLNDMIMPARRAASAKVKKEGAPGSGISLFNKKRVQGWYACTNPINPERCSGKIEVEIELLTEVEALERPAGQARDEPNQNPHLEPPKRPATSFMWFASPWKTFRYIIWKHYKWYIIGFIVLVLLVAAIVIFVYTAPSSVMDSLVRALDPRS